MDHNQNNNNQADPPNQNQNQNENQNQLGDNLVAANQGNDNGLNAAVQNQLNWRMNPLFYDDDDEEEEDDTMGAL